MSLFDQQSISMKNHPANQIINSEDLEDCELSDNHQYGGIKPFKSGIFGVHLYQNPQCGMLIFTIILTLTLEIVMLNFVFFGVHFYIGILLCLFILYLLLSLGYSSPGFGFQQYQRLQYHLDVEKCNENCRHPTNINQLFRYFCQKCNIPIKENTKHCNICNVCVYDYDHHCVFIGKCVGGNNIGKFKLFLFSIFSTLLYGLASALLNLKNIQQIQK